MWLSADCAEHSLEVTGSHDRIELLRAADALGIQLPTVLRGSVEKRRLEFLAGRMCAVRALRALGYGESAEIAVGPNREPVWPAGFVGSISHSHGRAWAVAARAGSIVSIGIDLEHWLDARAAAEMRPSLLGPDDDRRCSGTSLSDEQYLTLVFSAKESVYKALNPLLGVEFDFLQLGVEEISEPLGQVTVGFRDQALERITRLRAFDVRFRIEQDVVRTVAMLCKLPSD